MRLILILLLNITMFSICILITVMCVSLAVWVVRHFIIFPLWRSFDKLLFDKKRCETAEEMMVMALARNEKTTDI